MDFVPRSPLTRSRCRRTRTAQPYIILPALTVVECERHWTESRLFGALFGIAPTDLPADWASFVAYDEAMAQSDTRWWFVVREPKGGGLMQVLSAMPGRIPLVISGDLRAASGILATPSFV